MVGLRCGFQAARQACRARGCRPPSMRWRRPRRTGSPRPGRYSGHRRPAAGGRQSRAGRPPMHLIGDVRRQPGARKVRRAAVGSCPRYGRLHPLPDLLDRALATIARYEILTDESGGSVEFDLKSRCRSEPGPIEADLHDAPTHPVGQDGVARGTRRRVEKLRSALVAATRGTYRQRIPPSLSHPDTRCQGRTTSAGDAPQFHPPEGAPDRGA